MSMRFGRFLTLIAIAVATVAGSASARTWYVEKDGSGDFAVVQDALDAAASGDTVMIGVGRFDDVCPYTYPGGDYLITANVEVGDLTIIGAGQSSTIIGPAEYDWQEPDPIPIGVLYIRQEPHNVLRLRGLAVENAFWGLYVENSGSIDIEHVRFTGGRDGISSRVPSRVVNCSFKGMEHYGGMFRSAAGVQVLSSTFEVADAGGLHLYFCTDVEVRDCNITSSSGTSGAIGYFSSDGGVYDCVIMGSDLVWSSMFPMVMS